MRNSVPICATFNLKTIVTQKELKIMSDVCYIFLPQTFAVYQFTTFKSGARVGDGEIVIPSLGGFQFYWKVTLIQNY